MEVESQEASDQFMKERKTDEKKKTFISHQNQKDIHMWGKENNLESIYFLNYASRLQIQDKKARKWK